MTKPRDVKALWLAAWLVLGLLAAGCGATTVDATDDIPTDTDPAPGVFGTTNWGDGTWQ